MELEEKQAQECRQTGEEAPDAGGQEDFEELIRGKYKEFFDRRVKKILDGRLRAMRQENMRLREQQQRQKEEAAGRLCRLREQVSQRMMAREYCCQSDRRRGQDVRKPVLLPFCLAVYAL